MKHLSRRSLFSVLGAGAVAPLVASNGLTSLIQPQEPEWTPSADAQIKEPEGWTTNGYNGRPWPIFRPLGLDKPSFPCMAFFITRPDPGGLRIDKRLVGPEDLAEAKSIEEYYETLDVVDIATPSDIERVGYRIAHESHRGKGQHIVYYNRLPPLGRYAHWYLYPGSWTQTSTVGKTWDGIIAYSGATVYDQPFIGFQSIPGFIGTLWIAHPDYKKYVKRYRLS